MRKATVILMVVAFGAPSAFGAAVIFTPAYQEVVPGHSAEVTLGVALEQMDSFDAANMIIWSNDLLVDTFAYGQYWLEVQAFPPPPPMPVGFFPSDLFIGGFLSTASDQPWTVGTLTVGTAGLPIGEYEVVVDGEIDGISGLYLGSAKDTLTGSATVYYIPEPTALVLLGLGGLVTLRRRA